MPFLYVVGPIASGLVNLYGCRAVTMVGAVIGAFGFAISALAPGLWFLYISIGVVGGKLSYDDHNEMYIIVS